MFKNHWFFFTFFLTSLISLLSTLEANSPQPLTFLNLGDADFQSLQGKRVEIRGFLYKNGRDEWILAAEPNLKTCCMGSKEKRDRQLLIIDQIDDLPTPLPLTAITLQGDLIIGANSDLSPSDAKPLIPIYHLKNSIFIPSSSHPLFFSLVAIAIGFFTTLWMAKSFWFTSK